MAFYQANEVNPMSSCLPMFVQMPVFIVLYQVIRGLTRRLSTLGDHAGWVAGRLAGGGELTGPVSEPRMFYPDYLDPGSTLFHDLSGSTEMVSFGFDLSRSASDALSAGVVDSLPYLALILVVFVTSWYQQRQIRGRSPQAAINPQQQFLFKVMPFFLPVFSFGFDAALVVYFVASNLYRIAQQGYITRRFYGPGKDTAPTVVHPAASPARSVEKNQSSSGSSRKASRSSPRSSSEAKNKRTTAGLNSNQSQSETSRSPVSKSRARKGESSPAKTRKSRRRNRRAELEEEPRGPSSRQTGGRTTPPGTSRARSSRKKKRRK
jgi:YidC/Oxa1 family membrane protein insertase